MNTHEFDVRESNHSDTGNSGSSEALKRMHDDVAAARTANTSVRLEMSRVEIVCYPPPITPPCQPVEMPPNPAVVSGAVADLNKADRQLNDELANLKTDPTGAGKNYGKDLQTLSQQAKTFSNEIAGLNSLTTANDHGNHNYDKDGVLSETVKIAKLAKQLDNTLKQLGTDLGN